MKLFVFVLVAATFSGGCAAIQRQNEARAKEADLIDLTSDSYPLPAPNAMDERWSAVRVHTDVRDMRNELDTSNEILAAIPNSAKALKDKAILEKALPAYMKREEDFDAVERRQNAEWAAKPASVRAQEKDWDNTLDFYEKQGYLYDEAKVKADQICGPRQ